MKTSVIIVFICGVTAYMWLSAVNDEFHVTSNINSSDETTKSEVTIIDSKIEPNSNTENESQQAKVKLLIENSEFQNPENNTPIDENTSSIITLSDIDEKEWAIISEGRLADPNDNINLKEVSHRIQISSKVRHLNRQYPTACKKHLLETCDYSPHHRNEEEDLAWRYAMEETLYRIISLSRQPEGFKIYAIRCKQLICEVLVFYLAVSTPTQLGLYDFGLYEFLIRRPELKHIRKDVMVYRTGIGVEHELDLINQKGSFFYFVLAFYDEDEL